MKVIPGALYKQFIEDDAYWYPISALSEETVWIDGELLQINGRVYGDEDDTPIIQNEDKIKILDGYVAGHDISLKTFFNRWVKARESSYLVLGGKKESIAMLREEIKDRLKELKIIVL